METGRLKFHFFLKIFRYLSLPARLAVHRLAGFGGEVSWKTVDGDWRTRHDTILTRNEGKQNRKRKEEAKEENNAVL